MGGTAMRSLCKAHTRPGPLTARQSIIIYPSQASVPIKGIALLFTATSIYVLTKDDQFATE